MDSNPRSSRALRIAVRDREQAKPVRVAAGHGNPTLSAIIQKAALSGLFYDCGQVDMDSNPRSSRALRIAVRDREQAKPVRVAAGHGNPTLSAIIQKAALSGLFYDCGQVDMDSNPRSSRALRIAVRDREQAKPVRVAAGHGNPTLSAIIQKAASSGLFYDGGQVELDSTPRSSRAQRDRCSQRLRQKIVGNDFS